MAELTLSPEDLREEFKITNDNGGVRATIATRDVRFEHFSDKIQDALRIVGRGIYWEGGVYNAVNAPKQTPPPLMT